MNQLRCKRLRSDEDTNHVLFSGIFYRCEDSLETVLTVMGICTSFRLHFGPACSKEITNGNYAEFQTERTIARLKLKVLNAN